MAPYFSRFPVRVCFNFRFIVLIIYLRSMYPKDLELREVKLREIEF